MTKWVQGKGYKMKGVEILCVLYIFFSANFAVKNSKPEKIRENP